VRQAAGEKIGNRTTLRAALKRFWVAQRFKRCDKGSETNKGL